MYNEGHLIYTLDDPYIHMSIAKNVVKYGHCGVDKYQFSFPSSSPLWTFLMIFFYFIFGIKDSIPLILNLLFSTLTLLTIFYYFMKLKISPIFAFIALIVVIFITPLPSVVFYGLEHSLQIFIIILLTIIGSSVISEDSKKYTFLLYILSPLSVMIRYESLYLIFVISLLLFIRKKFFNAILLMFVSFIPVIAIGIFLKSKGWFFLPTSVFLKGNFPNQFSFGGILNYLFLTSILRITFNLPIFSLVLCLTIMLIINLKNSSIFWEKKNIFLFITIITTFIHMQFTKIQPFYRYEYYLFSLGMFTILVSFYEYAQDLLKRFRISNYIKEIIPETFFIFLITLPLMIRSYDCMSKITTTSMNIYQQQFQMAKFIKKYYNGEAILINDIGIVNYYTEIKCVDLWGLTNKETAILRKRRTYTAEKIFELSKKENVKIAVIYEVSFPIPKKWKKIGEWQISNNIICWYHIISFFAVDSLEELRLENNLKEFSKDLPSGVNYNFRRTLIPKRLIWE